MALWSEHGDCKESPAWILREQRELLVYSDFEGKETGKAGLDLIQRRGDLALTTASLGHFPLFPNYLGIVIHQPKALSHFSGGQAVHKTQKLPENMTFDEDVNDLWPLLTVSQVQWCDSLAPFPEWGPGSWAGS